MYAIHGHYLDCHLTVPTLERLSMGAMSRVLGRPAQAFGCVEDYEAVGAPVFAWRDAVARHARTGDLLSGVTTVDAWRALGGDRKGRARVAAAGKGQPRAQSCAGARSWAPSRSRWPRSTARGSDPCARTFHAASCAGPVWPRWGRWRQGSVSATPTWSSATPTGPGRSRAIASGSGAGGRPAGAGARLVNAGCWTYAPVFLTSTPGESPYWPGACVLVEDSGPPVLKRLLLDRTHAELRPTPA